VSRTDHEEQAMGKVAPSVIAREQLNDLLVGGASREMNVITMTSRPRTDETQGGQRYYEQGKPLSSHSP
jgi:hypothetical protein